MSMLGWEKVPGKIFLVSGESRHHGIKYNNHFDLCRSEYNNEHEEEK